MQTGAQNFLWNLGSEKKELPGSQLEGRAHRGSHLLEGGQLGENRFVGGSGLHPALLEGTQEACGGVASGTGRRGELAAGNARSGGTNRRWHLSKRKGRGSLRNGRWWRSPAGGRVPACAETEVDEASGVERTWESSE